MSGRNLLFFLKKNNSKKKIVKENCRFDIYIDNCSKININSIDSIEGIIKKFLLNKINCWVDLKSFLKYNHFTFLV